MTHKDGPVCNGCEMKLAGAHEYLGPWFRELKKRYPNAHISWGWRGHDDQERFFLEGKTKLHFPNSPHNLVRDGKPCSMALDLFLINEDGEATFPPLWYAKVNLENEAARLPILWGGKWKTLGDGDHFEYQPPTNGPGAQG